MKYTSHQSDFIHEYSWGTLTGNCRSTWEIVPSSESENIFCFEYKKQFLTCSPWPIECSRFTPFPINLQEKNVGFCGETVLNLVMCVFEHACEQFSKHYVSDRESVHSFTFFQNWISIHTNTILVQKPRLFSKKNPSFCEISVSLLALSEIFRSS